MPHIHEKIDFTVEVFIVHDNKVLLRKHDKYGIWLSVGGHIELDEDPQEAAIREVKEEVGLNAVLVPTSQTLDIETERYKHIISPAFINRHKINDTHEHITMVYFAKSDSDEINPGEGEQKDNCEWFTKDGLDSIKEGISETVRIYAKTALEKVNGN